MKLKSFLVLFIFCLLIFSCGMSVLNYGQENTEDENINLATIKEENNLFIEEEKSENYVFETNDKKFLLHNGCTLFTTPFKNSSSTFKTFCVDVCKQSGDTSAGYGIIFCRQIIDEKEFMICVLINTKGDFIVGKVIDNHFERICKWTKSKYLKLGYGINNKIKIEFNLESKEFNLYFNSKMEYTFSIEENISFDENKSGYVVILSDIEKFPIVPVKVIFKQN